MAEIIPFKGIRYSEKISIDKVVAPPYDVITDKAKYYNSHENNVIRLILGKEFAEDRQDNNKYTRAASYFKTWMENGILKQDLQPSIYVYEQRYFYKGKRKALRGFIALVRIEEFEKGIILPHEETLSKSIADRLELMRACKANFSPIFALYSDPNKTIDETLMAETWKKPVIDIENHRLWKISNASTIKKISREMKNKKLFIADGHHRYEASLRFRNEMRKIGSKAYDYTMMFLANLDGGGITILPAHRLIRDTIDIDIPKLLEDIRQYFSIEIFNNQRKRMLEQMEIRGEAEHVFGMYCRGKYYLLTLKDEKTLDKLIKIKGDVAILHSLLLDRIMGIKPENIKYVIDEAHAIQLVNEGKYQLALFLNPTKVGQVRDVALVNERMPGKATYFYPKLLTGLVMNKMG